MKAVIQHLVLRDGEQGLPQKLYRGQIAFLEKRGSGGKPYFQIYVGDGESSLGELKPVDSRSIGGLAEETRAMVAEATAAYVGANPEKLAGPPGKDGEPGEAPRIGGDGYWWLGGERLGKSKGNDGLSPEIGANGNWHVGGFDTGVRAQGRVGPKGNDGTGIAVEGTFDTLDQLLAAVAHADPGEGYMVLSDPDPSRNGLWIWSGASGRFVWAGDIRGPKGEQGDRGSPGERGEKGEPGEPGEAGIANVSHDGTMSGSGTPQSPLSVNFPPAASPGAKAFKTPGTFSVELEGGWHKVTVTGAGGAGARAQYSGGAGGAGGTVVAWANLAAGTYQVTVGRGGLSGGAAANAVTPGGDGGGSAFSGGGLSLSAGGGQGGQRAANTNVVGGIGGTCSSSGPWVNAVSAPGGDGGNGATASATSGYAPGGSSYWGGGGRTGQAGGTSGLDGKAPGSGGGGAASYASGVLAGNGADGAVIIERLAGGGGAAGEPEPQPFRVDIGPGLAGHSDDFSGYIDFMVMGGRALAFQFYLEYNGAFYGSPPYYNDRRVFSLGPKRTLAVVFDPDAFADQRALGVIQGAMVAPWDRVMFSPFQGFAEFYNEFENYKGFSGGAKIAWHEDGSSLEVPDGSYTMWLGASSRWGLPEGSGFTKASGSGQLTSFASF